MKPAHVTVFPPTSIIFSTLLAFLPRLAFFAIEKKRENIRERREERRERKKTFKVFYVSQFDWAGVDWPT